MQPVASHVGTSSATLRITGPVTRSAVMSGSSRLPQTPSPLKGDSPMKDSGKKRKRDDEDDEDDEAYNDRYDITAQSLVQQVTSNTMSAINEADMSTLCRRGHKPYESMGRSSSFTLATTNSCVSVIEALRRFMSRTSSNRPRALPLAMGNFMWASILPLFKT